MANNTPTTAADREVSDIARRILGIPDLDAKSFGFETGTGSIPYAAIKRALDAAYQAALKQSGATLPQQLRKSGAIEVGETVIFPYNGVNYTALVLHLNVKTAKIRITAMDAPPTRKGVNIGAELCCSFEILKRGK